MTVLTTSFWSLLILFEIPVVLQGLFAWRDQFLTPSQMVRHGIAQGLPFAAHGGMWGDVFFISPLLAALVEIYISGWSWLRIVAAFLASLFASYMMHETYKHAFYPEAHVQYGKLTATGHIHLVYMAVAFAVIGLYYIHAPYTPWMWLVSAFLVLHTIAGTHVILGIISPKWYGAAPLQSAGTWGAIGGTAVLTFGATGLRYLFR